MVTRELVYVWERGISVLRDEMFIGEVKQVNVRDEEELSIGVSNLGGRVVEMQGIFI